VQYSQARFVEALEERSSNNRPDQINPEQRRIKMAKVIQTGAGLLHKHKILVHQDTQTLLEQFYEQHSKRTGAGFTATIGHILAEYLKYWQQVEQSKLKK